MLDDDGFYKTGDVMAEIGPDQLVYVDRRNNVLKLSQGEFVAVSHAGGALLQQPARPADLRLRQQRTRVPARGRGADRRAAIAATATADRLKAAIRESLQQIAAGAEPATPMRSRATS